MSRPLQAAAKRALDVVGALAGLVLLSPLLLLTALAVRLRLGAPVLFRQVRPGRDGVPFELCKFRTMTDARDAAGRPLSDAERLTPLGRLLRSTSVDELPELINVLRGEMSLVGPRPLPVRDLEALAFEHHAWAVERQEVLPGLTGEWQVEGRAECAFEEMVRHDLVYVRERTLARDLRLLLRTVPAVLRGRGAY
jgi:lipopolysaccharide/colanic/teichoic acid biosynthesis glycosyltransferase